MKKVLFWCAFPFAIIIGLLFLPIVALNILYEKFQDNFTYFEGWCYDLPKLGYKFSDNGVWTAHWENVDGKFVNMLEDKDD